MNFSMIRKTSAIKPTKIKRRYKLIAAWLGFELLTASFALPAFAVLHERISFTVEQKVVVQNLGQSEGRAQFLVASNAPFAVISSGVISEMDITLTQSGTINGLSFGHKAQLPGPASTCNMPTHTRKSRIYTAQQKTAARRGSPLEQSVLVEITYAKELNPEFSIQTMDYARANSALLARPCTSPLS